MGEALTKRATRVEFASMIDFNRFNQGRIVIAEDHLGDPMRLPGVDANPFDNLDAASGCNSPDFDLARVGDLTREVQRGVESVTLLTHGLVNGADPKVVSSFIEREVAERVGDRLFYVASDTGEDFFQGRMGFGILQDIGSCGAFTREELLKLRNIALEVADRHDDFALRLVDSPRGGIILETGAGADFSRIKKMQEYAQRVGAKLICHDTAPLASKRSVDYLDGVPYLALPSSSELLSLPFADIGRPLTITLKDVVSSMAFGQMDELCEVAKNVGARKILVTQSLALAKQNNMFPEAWRFGSPRFAVYIVNTLLPLMMDYASSGQEVQPFFSYVALQVQHVIWLVMMELAKRAMCRYASQTAGLKTNRIVNVEDSTVLGGRDAAEYLSRFYPEIMPGFLEGKFNRVVSSPFGRNMSRDNTVSNGNLRVSSVRTHWEFVRGGVADIRPTKKTVVGGVSFGMANQVTVPREFWSFDKALAVATIRGLGMDVTLLSSLSPDKFRELNKLGAQLAMDIIFNVWGRRGGHKYVRAFEGKVEKEMHDTFVRGL